MERLNAALDRCYRIVRERGRNGHVYVAADLRHDRKVALEVLKRSGSAEA